MIRKAAKTRHRSAEGLGLGPPLMMMMLLLLLLLLSLALSFVSQTPKRQAAVERVRNLHASQTSHATRYTRRARHTTAAGCASHSKPTACTPSPSARARIVNIVRMWPLSRSSKAGDTEGLSSMLLLLLLLCS